MKWIGILLTCLLASYLGAQQLSPQEQKKEMAALTQLRAAQTSADKAFHARPRDAKVRQNYVYATVKLGMRTMYSAALTPHEKYTKAYVLFKEALKVDPTNRDAKENKELIESVYRSMGRKPPGG